MEIRLKNEQKQVLSQQMLQSMKILQMAALELEQYLEHVSMENPFLEAGVPGEPDTRIVYTDLARRGKTPKPEPGSWQRGPQTETLQEYLLEQIAMLELDAPLENAVRFLADHLDERGYLLLEEEDFPASWSMEVREKALELLQNMEPAGVGARSLGECLRIQLRRLAVEDSLPYLLTEGYLERLARGQMNFIAQQLHVSMEQIHSARVLLSQLNPKPGNGFGGQAAEAYIIPDVTVTFEQGCAEITVAEKYFSTFNISNYYSSLLERAELLSEERSYLLDKKRKAQWVIDCIEKRRETLLACARAIVRQHAGFFRDGVSALRPLYMRDVAEMLHLHPSTISRAVKGKYIECRWGVYPMAHFFQRNVFEDPDSMTKEDEPKRVTSSHIIAQMRALLGTEDKAHPLSDRALAEILAAQGYEISRRTVAKYREEALIPPASARRSRKEA